MVSIVIPYYNPDDNNEISWHCADLIRSIKLHTLDYEIIFVDNGGGEDFADEGLYIKNKINVGYGPAINQGFKLAKGDYLIAMNDDVEVREGWLEFIKPLEHPLTGVVRPAEDREQGGGIIQDHTWYHGFCWAIKRSLWQSMKDLDGNLLDEQFEIANFEDLDLWQRILNRNLKLVKNFNVRVYHYGGLTVKKLNLESNTLANEAKFIKKHNMPNWREVFYP